MEDKEDTITRKTATRPKLSQSCCQNLPKPCRGPDGEIQIEPLYCWINLFAAFMLNVLISSKDSGFAIFYDHLIERYDSPRSTIGFVFSCFMVVGGICGLFASPFVALYGCRPVALTGAVLLGVGSSLWAIAPNLGWLFFFYGIIGGLGNGCVFLSSMTIVQQSFTHNRGLATGISSLGLTAGTILCPVIVEYFLTQFSLTGALLLYGGLFVQGIVFTMLMHSPKHLILSNQKQERSHGLTQDIEQTKQEGVSRSRDFTENAEDIPLNKEIREKESLDPDSNENIKLRDSSTENRPNNRQMMKTILKGMIDFSVLQQVTFVLTILFYILYFFSRFAVFSQIVSAAIHRGISPKDAAYLITIIGFCNLVIRIISTIIMNFKWMNALLYTCSGFLLLASAAFVASQARRYEMFVGSMVLVGLSEGIANTIFPMVVVYVLGVKRFPRGFAILRVGVMTGILPATPLSGYLVDRTGDYTVSFMMSGVTGSMAAGLSLVVFFIINKQRKGLNKHVQGTSTE